jgi:cellulose synthase/poly-beta-1,6-N-acetylglucosamine synthase-like glycosyltransferase
VTSVLRQSGNEPLEVIVVVGPSEDRTLELARVLADRDPRVRVVENGEGTTPAALNHGIRASRGDVIARVDAHGWIAWDYLAEGLAALERSGADAVGGVVRFVGDGLRGRAIALAQGSRIGGGTARFRSASEDVESDGLSWGLYHRNLFTRVGLFDEELLRNQDDELCHRIVKAGGRMVVTARMRYWSRSRSSLGALARQYREWGRYRMLTFAKHGPANFRQLLPPSLVAGLVLTLAVDALSDRRPRLTPRIAGIYLGGVLCGSVAAAAGEDEVELAPLVAAASMTMHLSYGLGVWQEAIISRRWARR